MELHSGKHITCHHRYCPTTCWSKQTILEMVSPPIPYAGHSMILSICNCLRQINTSLWIEDVWCHPLKRENDNFIMAWIGSDTEYLHIGTQTGKHSSIVFGGSYNCRSHLSQWPRDPRWKYVRWLALARRRVRYPLAIRSNPLKNSGQHFAAVRRGPSFAPTHHTQPAHNGMKLEFI